MNEIDPRPCGGCERGAPFDGPFKGADLQCSACWLWKRDPEACRVHWLNAPPKETLTSTITMPAKTQGGPGTELKDLLAQVGLDGESCSGWCAARAELMDQWGVQGCKENRDLIVRWLAEGYHLFDWKARLTAAALALKTGLALQINPLNPLGSLVDLAIKRVIAKLAAESSWSDGEKQTVIPNGTTMT